MNKIRAIVLEAPHLPGLGQEGPEDLRLLLGVFYLLLAVGLVTGILGHVIRSRTLVAAGVAIIFVGTGFFLAAVGTRG